MEGPANRVTQKEIADKAGVTSSTVSKALNNVAGVHRATRRKIKYIAKELAYSFTPSLVKQQNSKQNPVESNKAKSPRRQITIYDIAKALNVSAATVSRALNNSNKVNKNTLKRIMVYISQSGYDINQGASGLAKKKARTDIGATTIYDLAKQLNLSAATVSRSLSDNKLVNIETKKRVQSTAKQMGFSVNLKASTLVPKRRKVIGLLAYNLRAFIASEIFTGIEDECGRQGYNLLICSSPQDQSKEAAYPFTENIDGVIVASAANHNYIASSSPGNKIVPEVSINNSLLTNIVMNGCDQYEETYKLTKYLIDKGCRKIFFWRPAGDASVGKEQSEGYNKAIAEQSLVAYNSIYTRNRTISGSEEKIWRQIISRKPFPDAVILTGTNDAVFLAEKLKNADIEKNNVVIAGLGFFADMPGLKKTTRISATGCHCVFGKLITRALIKKMADKKTKISLAVCYSNLSIIEQS